MATYDNIVTDGLLFHVDAGNKVSSTAPTTTNNIVNVSDAGTFNGATIVNGEYVLDGIDDFIDFGDLSYLDLGVFTLNAWFKFNSPIQKSIIIDKRVSGDDDIGNVNYGMIVKNNFFGGFYSDGAALYEARETGLSLVADKWYNIVMTYDGSDIITYLDGSFSFTLSTTATPEQSGVQLLTLGIRDSSDPSPLFGSISTTSIYNRALTAEEVKKNYEAQKHRFE